jgi:hypothetical protein
MLGGTESFLHGKENKVESEKWKNQKKQLGLATVRSL